MTTHFYFLDSSCGPNFQTLFERAQSFAARAAERLDDPEDTQFAEVFKLIFKTTVTDTLPMPRSPRFQPAPGQDHSQELRPRPVVAHVRRELHSLAHGWARTRAREDAEVRIHWDGLGRYLQVWPSVFFDPVNYLVRNQDREDVERLFREATASVMSEHSVELRLMPEEGHHPRRVVIDFTNMAWMRKVSWEACEAFNLVGCSLDHVADDLIETTLVHEMMHSSAYKLLDFFDDGESTSGWRLIMGLSKEQSYICAESIAMLCLVAGLGDLRPVGLPFGHRYTISEDGKIIGEQEEMTDWILV